MKWLVCWMDGFSPLHGWINPSESQRVRTHNFKKSWKERFDKILGAQAIEAMSSITCVDGCMLVNGFLREDTSAACTALTLAVVTPAAVIRLTSATCSAMFARSPRVGKVAPFSGWSQPAGIKSIEVHGNALGTVDQQSRTRYYVSTGESERARRKEQKSVLPYDAESLSTIASLHSSLNSEYSRIRRTRLRFSS